MYTNLKTSNDDVAYKERNGYYIHAVETMHAHHHASIVM